ncbi:MAG: hypothetical protein IPJ30_12705 [Acidobacteria bacterium]|nr:hypothetical protein [Acidobacteriota bacterium]
MIEFTIFAPPFSIVPATRLKIRLLENRDVERRAAADGVSRCKNSGLRARVCRPEDICRPSDARVFGDAQDRGIFRINEND